MKHIFILLSLFFTLSAFADEEPKFITKYGDWKVYTQVEDGEKSCFILSYPIDEAGNYKKRGDAHLWVRYVNSSTDEVSATTGYSAKSSTFPKMAIYSRLQFSEAKSKELLEAARNGKCYSDSNVEYLLDLIQRQIAWFHENTTDEKVVQLMKKKYSAVITATSSKNTCSTDVYSLMGFTKAYNHMKSLCGS